MLVLLALTLTSGYAEGVSSPVMDPEVAAIAAISGALGELPDVDARRRVLSYVMARFGVEPMASSRRVEPSSAPPNAFPAQATDESSVGNVPPSSVQEIPGVAKITSNGELKITVRDLKAKSGLDAAVRLAHVAIYAHEKLRGEPLSSRHVLTPILKEWRLYDGNTRARLAKEKGILRDGDALHLDAHSRRDAQRYIEEILDPDIAGSWRAR